MHHHHATIDKSKLVYIGRIWFHQKILYYNNDCAINNNRVQACLSRRNTLELSGHELEKSTISEGYSRTFMKNGVIWSDCIKVAQNFWFAIHSLDSYLPVRILSWTILLLQLLLWDYGVIQVWRLWFYNTRYYDFW